MKQIFVLSFLFFLNSTLKGQTFSILFDAAKISSIYNVIEMGNNSYFVLSYKKLGNDTFVSTIQKVDSKGKLLSETNLISTANNYQGFYRLFKKNNKIYALKLLYETQKKVIGLNLLEISEELIIKDERTVFKYTDYYPRILKAKIYDNQIHIFGSLDSISEEFNNKSKFLLLKFNEIDNLIQTKLLNANDISYDFIKYNDRFYNFGLATSEMDDSLQNIINVTAFNANHLFGQVTTKNWTDSTYLIGGIDYNILSQNPSDNEGDISLVEANYKHEPIKKFVLVKRDTAELPAFHNCFDFYDRNNLFLGGTANYRNTNPNDSIPQAHFVLVNLDKNLKSKWIKYFPSNNSDKMYGVLATSDGGCVMYGKRLDFSDNSYKFYLLKVNSLGQLLAANGTPLPEENVKIFPNPARDILSISASDSEAHLTVQCFDNQGRSVYQCDFQGFAQINVSDWQRGVYACVIRDKNGAIVKTEKVIMDNW